MSTVFDREVLNTDPVELVKTEIEASRNEHRPISRQLLADMVSTKTGMKSDQAWLLVDAYCEEHEAAIPGYLRSEFNMHWPKVIGVFIAAGGLFIGWLGIRAGQAGKASWPYFAAATIVFGLGALMFVHSLEGYQRFIRERREALRR